MKTRTLLLITLSLLLVACGNRNREDLSVEYDESDIGELVVSEEAMDAVIANIASPIEVASFLNDLEIPFSTAYLSDPEGMSTHTTSFEIAYQLGVLSADLGYLNMYDKTGTAVNYLGTINRMAEALEVGQFFDFATIKRLATSGSNLDSLLFMSMNSFNRMDDYLRESQRSNLSALMVAGVWIEGLYLATQVMDKTGNPELKDMIGEQKTILNDLLIILNNYRQDERFAALISDYNEIKEAYDRVNISYEIGEPEAVEKDGMLMVVQNETTTIEMDNETLNRIIDVTRKIRNKHLNT